MGAFADYLADARNDAGLTRKELAKRAGLKPDTVQALEEGRGWPLPSALQAIAEVVSVEPRVLVQLADAEMWRGKPAAFSIYDPDFDLGDVGEAERINPAHWTGLIDAYHQAMRDDDRRKKESRNLYHAQPIPKGSGIRQ